MGRYVKAAEIRDVPLGGMRKVEADGTPVLLVNLDGTLYAVSPRCPHLGGDLSRGKLEGSIVTCPRHGSQFDVTNGRVVRWLQVSGFVKALSGIFIKSRPLTTYPVKIEGDTVLVEIPGEYDSS